MSDIGNESVTREAGLDTAGSNQVELSANQSRQTFGQMLRNDLSFLPVLLTLIVIWAYFGISTQGLFLYPRNLSNLVLQIATTGVYALSVTPVLLIGEIDLSLVSVGTLGAVIMGVLVQRAGWSAGPAIAVALLSGAIVGMVNGLLVAVVRIPAFIVTLAASIAYEGLLLYLQFGQSTLIITNDTIISIAGSPRSYLPWYLGIGLPIVVVVLYIIGVLYGQLQRYRAGLKIKPLWQLILQLALVVALVGGTVLLFENYLGVPNTTVILIGLILIFWLVLTKTGFGRHIYAVGGNSEASRRAGINVTAIRIVVFTLCSTLAVLGSIIEASRQTAVASLIDPTLLLSAIAAAVIGGISLFGGRGSVWSIILGVLIIGSLINGLALMGQTQAVEEMIEGAVLAIAVAADAIIRRAQARTGR
jgi:D-xylose transport system permease protein